MSSIIRHAVEPKALTESEWESLLNRQRIREESAFVLGGDRFRKRLEQAEQEGAGSTVGAARKLLSIALDETEANIYQIVNDKLGAWDPESSARAGGPKGRRHTLVSWVDVCEKTFKEEISYGGLAYMTLKVILDNIHSRPALTALSLEIGNKLIDEMRYRKFRKEAPGLFHYRMNSFSTNNYAHRARSLSHAMRYAEVDASEFNLPQQQKERMGTKLIECVMLGPGLVERENEKSYVWSGGKILQKDEIKIVATEETHNWLTRRNDKLEFLQPVLSPMIVPPVKWSPDQNGGYRFALRTGHRSGVIRPKFGMKENPAADREMPLVYEGLNRMQETSFSIDLRVLDLMEEIARSGGALAGIPSLRKVELPIKTFDTEKHPDDLKKDPEFRRWKRDAAKAHAKEAERAARYREFDRTLEAAQAVSDERAIWFPWNLDFRGRAYPISDALSPQGDDRQKALLRFATGKPLGAHGAFHLAVHGANCLDEVPESFPPIPVPENPKNRKFGKLSVQERNDWIEEHTLDIVAVAEDPFTHDWWMEAEDPFMFFAFCLEWAGYWEAYQRGEGEQYVSHLPVAADGTCNGLQHFAAAWRDAHGARFVNVTANERPEDVYAEVERAVTKRLSDPRYPRPTNELWLSSGLLSRSLFKRPTMTFGYGSETYGFADQIREYLRDKTDFDATKDHFQLPIENEEGEVRMREVVGMACQDLAWHIWEALDEVVVAAKHGMKWMQECAKAVTKLTGKPVEWEVPMTDFRVVQPYFKTDRKRISTVLCGKVIKPVYYKHRKEPYSVKQANGISPNVIHSLDAAALMLTVVNCSREQEGMSFLMVHDSFATHAGDAHFLAKTIRESFVQLYTSHDVVEDLYQQFREAVGEEQADEIPAPPAKGDLDLAEVLESDHFFC